MSSTLWRPYLWKIAPAALGIVSVSPAPPLVFLVLPFVAAFPLSRFAMPGGRYTSLPR